MQITSAEQTNNGRVGNMANHKTRKKLSFDSVGYLLPSSAIDKRLQDE